ncbi:MAG: site-2 protease family protein [Bacilli bacterium]
MPLVATTFRIHPLLWLVFAVSILTGQFFELAAMFIIVSLHECGHFLMIKYFKWNVRSVELLPFGGVVETESIGTKRGIEELLVVCAGPFVHVIIGFLLYFVHPMHVLSEEVYEYLWQQNLVLLLFNLLPIWPLDGSKLLFHFISHKIPFATAYKVVFIVSAIGILLFSTLILLAQQTLLTTLFVTMFFIYTNITDWKNRHYSMFRYLKYRYESDTLQRGEEKEITVRGEAPLFRVVRKFVRGKKYKVNVTNGKATVLDEKLCLHIYFFQKEPYMCMNEVKKYV